MRRRGISTRHMIVVRRMLVMIVGLGALAACGNRPAVRRGPLPTGCLPATYDAGPGCHFPSGRLCPAHSWCPDDDNCNGCSCLEFPDGGLALECSLVGCGSVVRTCTEVSSWDCQLPSGRWCGPGCIADDGCNTCQCTPDGVAHCTNFTCGDAGVSPCHSALECDAGERCIPSSIGCTSSFQCDATPVSGNYQWACGCDGQTRLLSSNPPDTAVQHFGPCAGYHSHIGDPCTTDADCGGTMRCGASSSGSFCFETCNSTSPLECPADATCVTDRDPFYSECLRHCSSDADCRVADGFRCLTFHIAGGFAGTGCTLP